jgi:hypothetical protein
LGHARNITAGPVKARDEAELDGIAADFEDNRNCLGCCLSRERGWSGGRGNHSDLTMNKVVHHHQQPVTLTLSPAIFDRDVLALHIAGLLQP